MRSLTTYAKWRGQNSTARPSRHKMNLIAYTRQRGMIKERLSMTKDKKIKVALAEYERIRSKAYAEYERVRCPALAECDRIRSEAFSAYEHVRGPALAGYAHVCDLALAEYERRSEERRVGKECRSRWAP